MLLLKNGHKNVFEQIPIFFKTSNKDILYYSLTIFEAILKEKRVLAGSSAGANYLSKYGVTNNGEGIIEGLGLLNHVCIPHADVWDLERCVDFVKTSHDLPILLLEEYQTVEFEI